MKGHQAKSSWPSSPPPRAAEPHNLLMEDRALPSPHRGLSGFSFPQSLTCPAADTASTPDTDQTALLYSPAHVTPTATSPLVLKPISSLSVSPCPSRPIPAGPPSPLPRPDPKTVSSSYTSPATAQGLPRSGGCGSPEDPSQPSRTRHIPFSCHKTHEIPSGPRDPEPHPPPSSSGNC